MDEKEKIKKLCSLIVSICGLMLVLAGIIVLAINESHCGSSGSGLSRASTEIEFGADFYTTMAQCSALNANTAVDIFKLLKMCFGITFIFSGLITFFLNLPNTLCMLSLNLKRKSVIAETIDVQQSFEEENI